jgi:hypothetical protein
MLNKIYLIALALFVILSAFITWYAGTWLTSIGNPKAAEDGYIAYSSFGFTVLWIGFFSLLILANVILWNTRRAWAMWLTFAYATVFIFLRYWWLEDSYLRFALRNGLTDSTFSLGPLWAAALVIGIGALVFFDQFVMLRLVEKMYPTQKEESELPVSDPDIPSPQPASDDE